MALRPAAAAVLLLATAATGCTGASAGARAARASAPPAPASAAPTPTPARSAATPRLRVARAGWSLPAARSREVVVPIGSALLVAGGLSSADVSTDTVWLLDPATGRVRSHGRLATAVHDATGFALGGTGFVVAGGGASTVATVQRIVPGGTAVPVGRLPQPRSDLVSTVAGGIGYVLGGFDGTTSLPDVLATRDGHRFGVVARLPVPVRYAAVAAVDGRLFVFGGEHDGVGISVVQEVDPAAHRARVVGHLPHALAHEAVFVVGGDVWLAGGREHARLLRTVWRWDPRTRRVSTAGRLPYAVADAGAAAVGTTGYLLGGEAPTPVASVVVLRFTS